MDLMEVPSHVTEHFARSGPSLRAFMRHHISGRPMPAPLVQRMRASQSLFEATNLQQQARPQPAVCLFGKREITLTQMTKRAPELHCSEQHATTEE